MLERRKCPAPRQRRPASGRRLGEARLAQQISLGAVDAELHHLDEGVLVLDLLDHHAQAALLQAVDQGRAGRSEEHTSELQSLMRISYAVFCLKKQKHNTK